MTNDLSSLPHRSKYVVERLYAEVWNQGYFEHLHDYLAARITFHFRGRSVTHTAEDLIHIVSRWRSAFPDLHFEIKAIIAEEDLVAIRLIRRGTQQAVWRGIAPTGRQMLVDEMVFLRFADGRIVEVWEVTDEYAERQQLLGTEE